MIRSLLNTANVGWFIIASFIFGTIFPTLRAVLIGSEGSTSVIDYAISAIPDVITLFIFCISLLIHKEKTGNYFFSLNKRDYILIFILAYSLIVGGLISGDIKLIVYSVRMTYLPMLFYFTARLLGSFWEEEFVFKLIKTFMYWLGITAIIGLLLYFVFDNLEEQLKDIVHANKGEYYIERLNSIYHAPTLNGSYMAMAALFFLMLWHFSINIPQIVFLFAISASLLLSVSRGGIIGFIVSASAGIVWIRRWKSTVFVGFLVLASVWVTSLAVGLSFNNLGWIFKSTASTVKMEEGVTRVGLWESAYTNIKDKPFGYGLGKSGWIAYRFLKDSDESSSYTSTDGWYLKQANETGIIGVLSYLVFFAFYIVHVFPAVKRNSFDLLMFILLLLFQVLLVCLVSNVLDYFTFNAVFWFLLALGENMASKRLAEKKPSLNR
ncbi:MAG: O-antigen ligase family protein [Bacteroidia bacterium]